MSILKRIVINPAFSLCLFYIFIQQLLVATGTYLMGDLAASATENDLSITKISILVLSLIFSGSLFQYLMKYQLKKAEKNVLWSFFIDYKNANYGQSCIWRNATEKKNRHDVMIKEGQDTLVSSVHFAADSVATILNILFNSISVVLVTSPVLGVSIFCAGFIGLLIIHVADKSITRSAAEEMEAQNAVNAHLERSWDNIILGNKTSSEKWMSKFTNLFETSRAKSLDNVKINDAIVSLAGFATSLLVVGTVFGLIHMHHDEKAKVIALLVMLPRSMQIVMHTQVIQSYWAHWKYLLQRLHITEKTYLAVNEVSIDHYIKYQDMNITPETAENIIAQSQFGRFTIKGKNGSGKSTLLLKLKNILKDNGLYIPAHHKLEMSKDTFALSSGQVAICAIEEAIQDSARVILLDEWDANLSKDKQLELNEAINNLSKTKVVIEVRHHG